jgi:amino acid permease
MKLIDIILLSLSAGFLIIGVHQLIVITNNENITVGFTQSYWVFMLSISLFLLYQLRKKKQEATENHAGPPARPSRTGKPARKGGKNR